MKQSTYEERLRQKYPNELPIVIDYQGMLDPIIIKCRWCGDIHEYKQARDPLRAKGHKPICKTCNQMAKIDMIYWFNHTGYKNWEKFGNDQVKCFHCGTEFFRPYKELTMGGRGRCWCRNRSAGNGVIFNPAKLKHFHVQEPIVSASQPVRYIHDKCGQEFISAPQSLGANPRCPICHTN